MIPNTGWENGRQNIVFFNQFNISNRRTVWMTGSLVIAQLITTMIKNIDVKLGRMKEEP